MAAMRKRTRPTFTCRLRRGFTLIELMIAVFVSLILIVGVGFVFRKAADTVSMGQALSTLARDNRSLQATMGEDFQNFAYDNPVLIIVNQVHTGYVDPGDYAASNSSSNATSADLNGSGKSQYLSGAITNDYVHRHDTLAFCVRGKYQRRASAAGFADTTSTVDAFVWYGMMGLADNTVTPANSVYWLPGQGYQSGSTTSYIGDPGANPNGFFGTQWTLGRMCILLDPNAPVHAGLAGTNGNYFPSGTAANHNLTRNPDPYFFAPLAGGTVANQLGSDGKPIPIESGILDLAHSDFPTLRSMIVALQNGRYCKYPILSIVPSSVTPSWVNNLPWIDSFLQMPLPNGAEGSAAPAGKAPYYAFWNNYSASTDNENFTPNVALRSFFGRNWISKPLITTTGTQTPFDQASQMSFNLMPGVTQFIVEYAGDYLNQDPNTGAVKSVWSNEYFMGGGGFGQSPTNNVGYQFFPWCLPTDGPTDGKIDFTVDADGSHRIMWYGFPRDVAGYGVTPGTGTNVNNFPATIISTDATNAPDGSIPTPVQSLTGTQNYAWNHSGGTGVQPLPPHDVVPLRDILMTCGENPFYLWGEGQNVPNPTPYPASSWTTPPPWFSTTGEWWNVRAPHEVLNGSWPCTQFPYGGMSGYACADYVPRMSFDPSVSPSGGGNQQFHWLSQIWGSHERRPWLIRVTITVHDPNRAVHNGQTFQYIFNVPH